MLRLETPAASDNPIDDSINTTNAKSSSCGKTVRFASPYNIPSPGLYISLHSCDRDGNRNVTNPENYESNNPRYGIASLKRQKLFPNRVKATSHKCDKCFSLIILGINSVVGLERLSNGKAASTINIAIFTSIDFTIITSHICL